MVRRRAWIRVAAVLIGLGAVGFALAFPLGANAAPADPGPAVVQRASGAPETDTTSSTPVDETTTPSTPVVGTTTPSSSLSLSASGSGTTTPSGSFGVSDEVSSRPIASTSRTGGGGLAGTGSPSDQLIALGIVLFLLGGLMLFVAGPRWTPRHR